MATGPERELARLADAVEKLAVRGAKATGDLATRLESQIEVVRGQLAAIQLDLAEMKGRGTPAPAIQPPITTPIPPPPSQQLAPAQQLAHPHRDVLAPPVDAPVPVEPGGGAPVFVVRARHVDAVWRWVAPKLPFVIGFLGAVWGAVGTWLARGR